MTPLLYQIQFAQDLNYNEHFQYGFPIFDRRNLHHRKQRKSDGGLLCTFLLGGRTSAALANQQKPKKDREHDKGLCCSRERLGQTLMQSAEVRIW